ncbi:MAG: ComEC/Rec2 family competence protein, partial [Patescibacteria group bacterium]
MVRLAYMAATLTLLALGFVHGRESSRLLSRECELTLNVNAVIAAVHKIEAQRVQYIIEKEDGCRILMFGARFPLYGAGEKIRVTGEVESVQDFPEELTGYGKYLLRKGISGTMRYPDVASERGSGPGLRENLRWRVVRLFPEPEASAVLAMVLGQAGTLPGDTVDHFRRVGVTHILAISGMNLSLLTVAILGLSFLLPLKPGARTMLVIALMWLYVWLIVYPISAVRAAWFWTLALAGLQLRVLVSLPTIFLLAVAAMVTLDPRIILDIGFQLSVSAVAGMWVAGFLTPRFAKEKKWLPRWLRVTILATVGATITTWPIVTYHFGIISLVSLPANILIVPPVSAFMILSLLAIATSFFPPLGLVLSFGVRVLWQWMTGVASILAAWP